MLDEELDQVAGGDPRKARYLQQCLHQLATARVGMLREMAESVFQGEIGLRSAAQAPCYGAELGHAFDQFWSHYQGLTEEAQRDLRQAGLDHLNSLTSDGG